MSEQTETYRWLPWVVAGAAVVLIGFSITLFDLGWRSWLGIMPWEQAQNVDVMRAIHAFDEGLQDSAPYWPERAKALAGLLIVFVLGPSLWIFSEVRNQEEGDPSADQLKKGAGWYAGVMTMIVGLLIVFPGTVVKGNYFQNTWESADKSRNIDELRSELLALGIEAAEWYYLTNRNDRSSGFQALATGEGGESANALEALETYPHNTANSYISGPLESDSLITIYGIGYEVGPDPEFENANGDRGKIQVAVEVDPHGRIVHFVNDNTNL